VNIIQVFRFPVWATCGQALLGAGSSVQLLSLFLCVQQGNIQSFLEGFLQLIIPHRVLLLWVNNTGNSLPIHSGIAGETNVSAPMLAWRERHSCFSLSFPFPCFI